MKRCLYILFISLLCIFSVNAEETTFTDEETITWTIPSTLSFDSETKEAEITVQINESTLKYDHFAQIYYVDDSMYIQNVMDAFSNTEHKIAYSVADSRGRNVVNNTKVLEQKNETKKDNLGNPIPVSESLTFALASTYMNGEEIVKGGAYEGSCSFSLIFTTATDYKVSFYHGAGYSADASTNMSHIGDDFADSETVYSGHTKSGGFHGDENDTYITYVQGNDTITSVDFIADTLDADNIPIESIFSSANPFITIYYNTETQTYSWSTSSSQISQGENETDVVVATMFEQSSKLNISLYNISDDLQFVMHYFDEIPLQISNIDSVSVNSEYDSLFVETSNHDAIVVWNGNHNDGLSIKYKGISYGEMSSVTFEMVEDNSEDTITDISGVWYIKDAGHMVEKSREQSEQDSFAIDFDNNVIIWYQNEHQWNISFDYDWKIEIYHGLGRDAVDLAFPNVTPLSTEVDMAENEYKYSGVVYSGGGTGDYLQSKQGEISYADVYLNERKATYKATRQASGYTSLSTNIYFNGQSLGTFSPLEDKGSGLLKLRLRTSVIAAQGSLTVVFHYTNEHTVTLNNVKNSSIAEDFDRYFVKKTNTTKANKTETIFSDDYTGPIDMSYTPFGREKLVEFYIDGNKVALTSEEIAESNIWYITKFLESSQSSSVNDVCSIDLSTNVITFYNVSCDIEVNFDYEDGSREINIFHNFGYEKNNATKMALVGTFDSVSIGDSAPYKFAGKTIQGGFFEGPENGNTNNRYFQSQQGDVSYIDFHYGNEVVRLNSVVSSGTNCIKNAIYIGTDNVLHKTADGTTTFPTSGVKTKIAIFAPSKAGNAQPWVIRWITVDKDVDVIVHYNKEKAVTLYGVLTADAGDSKYDKYFVEKENLYSITGNTYDSWATITLPTVNKADKVIHFARIPGLELSGITVNYGTKTKTLTSSQGVWYYNNNGFNAGVNNADGVRFRIDFDNNIIYVCDLDGDLNITFNYSGPERAYDVAIYHGFNRHPGVNQHIEVLENVNDGDYKYTAQTPVGGYLYGPQTEAHEFSNRYDQAPQSDISSIDFYYNEQMITLNSSMNGTVSRIRNAVYLDANGVLKKTADGDSDFPINSGMDLVKFAGATASNDASMVSRWYNVPGNITLVMHYKNEHKIYFNGVDSVSLNPDYDRYFVTNNKITHNSEVTFSNNISGHAIVLNYEPRDLSLNRIEICVNGNVYGLGAGTTQTVSVGSTSIRIDDSAHTLTIVSLWNDVGINFIYNQTVSHTVNYYVNDTLYTSQNVSNGDTASKPSDPIIDGYTFNEWRANYGTYNFNTKVAEDINLYASFDVLHLVNVKNAKAVSTSIDWGSETAGYVKNSSPDNWQAYTRGGYISSTGIQLRFSYSSDITSLSLPKTTISGINNSSLSFSRYYDIDGNSQSGLNDSTAYKVVKNSGQKIIYVRFYKITKDITFTLN